MEEMHQRKVEKMIKSAEESAGLLHIITKPTMWREGVQILEKEEGDAKCWNVAKQKEKNGQNICNAMRRYRKCNTSL